VAELRLAGDYLEPDASSWFGSCADSDPFIVDVGHTSLRGILWLDLVSWERKLID
jgi:hypothetical protein